MDGIINFIIGYVILLTIWLVVSFILFLLSLLFRKNISTISLVLTMILDWGLQIYVGLYGLYILIQIIIAKEWFLLILALVFGGFLIGIWQWFNTMFLLPFHMIGLFFTGKVEGRINNSKQESSADLNSENAIIDGDYVDSEAKSPDKFYCSKCRELNNSEAAYCKACGNKL